VSVGGKDAYPWIDQALSTQRHPRHPQPGMAGVPLRRLLSDEPLATDSWHVPGPVHTGQTGAIRWSHAGQWLWGMLEAPAWDDAHASDPVALADSAEALYRELLVFLRNSPTPHLQRVWNYLPHITRVDGGLERYRRFNLGRQKALLAAQQAAFEGAPAACALGTHAGPLCLRFLAASNVPLAIENPRQVSAYRYPAEYGPASPSFSRAALCDAGAGQVALLISGTASVVGHASVHLEDLPAQLSETVRNLEAVIDAARQRCDAPLQLANCDCVVYVRHAEDAAAVQQAWDQLVGPDSRAARSAVYLHADVCRNDLLLEIEAHAWAPGKILA